MNKTIVKDIQYESAVYYRESNPVQGAGAIAHCDGSAILVTNNGNFLVRVESTYNPATDAFAAHTIPEMDISQFTPDAIHNNGLEWIRKDMCEKAARK